MISNFHTVRSYDSELGEVDSKILTMGGLVEDHLRNGIKSLVEGNTELARQVVVADLRIDELEREVDELVTRIIALRQPMAEDLRRIKTALVTASNLERMGDLAANVAKRCLVIEDAQRVPQREAIRRLGTAVFNMTVSVMDAYRDRDADLALRIWLQDESIDEMYNNIFRSILDDMLAEQDLIEPGIHVQFVAKNIERIGDHATNIAEMVSYLIEGHLPEDDRPKSSGIASFDVDSETT